MDTGASNYRRFLEGDDDVLVHLIEPYKDGLILYLTKFTNDVFLAEDLMEDTRNYMMYNDVMAELEDPGHKVKNEIEHFTKHFKGGNRYSFGVK